MKYPGMFWSMGRALSQICWILSLVFLQDWSFLAKNWVSHLLDLPEEGEVQSHCIFFSHFEILAETPSEGNASTYPPKHGFVPPAMHSCIFHPIYSCSELLHHKPCQGRLLPGIPTTSSPDLCHQGIKNHPNTAPWSPAGFAACPQPLVFTPPL